MNANLGRSAGWRAAERLAFFEGIRIGMERAAAICDARAVDRHPQLDSDWEASRGREAAACATEIRAKAKEIGNG